MLHFFLVRFRREIALAALFIEQVSYNADRFRTRALRRSELTVAMDRSICMPGILAVLVLLHPEVSLINRGVLVAG